jgi:hypothetical protein
MATRRTKGPIQPHTEYSHGRFRCLGCGETVRVEDQERERRLCEDCATAP